MGKFDHKNRMITLSVITLSGLPCIMLIAKSMIDFLIFWLILNLLKVFLPIRQIHVTTESESNDLKTQKYKIRV